MNFNRQAQADRSSGGFQMAPMMDVIFLLLLFWMVTSIYAQWERNIDLTVPTAETGNQDLRKMGELIINIDRAGVITINSIEHDEEALRRTLSIVARQHAGSPVIIRGDAETHYQRIVTVLDICRLEKIYNISFASVPAKDAPTGGARDEEATP